MEIRNTFITDNDKFFFANIWVTLYCNYCCKYCYETSDKPNMYMSTENADKVADYIIENCEKENDNAIWLNFHGGEPTLNTKVVKRILNRISERKPDIKLHTSLTTNCSIYDGELCDYISELSVSIDGVREAHDINRMTHDDRGTYDTSLKNALKYLENYGSDLRVRTVIAPNNVMYVYEGIKYLYELGFRIIVPGVDFFSEEWTDELFDLLYEQLAMVKNFSMSCEEGTIIGLIDDPIIKKGKCYVGCDGTNISVDGKLYPCTYVVGEKEFCIGDVFTGVDNDIVDKINCINTKDVEVCNGCDHYDFCDSPRCLILNKKLTGDFYTPSAIVCAEENLKFKLRENNE